MQTLKTITIFRTLCLGLMMMLAKQAFSTDVGLKDLNDSSFAKAVVVVAAADAEGNEAAKPESGTLVLPAAAEKKEAEKKCMTVCQKWGQDCVYDNQRGRKCRRTCKQFGEECF